jgi:hypothetical protein
VRDGQITRRTRHRRPYLNIRYGRDRTAAAYGVQVGPLTAETLADAIASLMADAPRRHALAPAARLRAEAFTARWMPVGTFAAYEKALRRAGARL